MNALHRHAGVIAKHVSPGCSPGRGALPRVVEALHLTHGCAATNAAPPEGAGCIAPHTGQGHRAAKSLRTGRMRP